MTEKKELELNKILDTVFSRGIIYHQQENPFKKEYTIDQATTDILKIIEKEKFRAIEKYAKEIIPKINAKWRKRLKAVELDEEKIADIIFEFLDKNGLCFYVDDPYKMPKNL